MPHTEDGAKWACESCIRGHRANKCDHFNERWMFRVKKPGRPLTTCPHSDKPCSCDEEAYIMVRVHQGAENQSHFCRPVKAAQAPQDCRLQIDPSIPWTPRHNGRPTPQTPGKHRRNLSNDTKGSGKPRIKQRYSHGAISAPQLAQSITAEAQKPLPNFHPGQATVQQNFGQQPSMMMSSFYPSAPNFNGLPPQMGPMNQIQPQSHQPDMQLQPNHIQSPDPTPSPQVQGCCCSSSQPAHNQPSSVFQQAQTQVFSNGQQHNQQPHPFEHAISNGPSASQSIDNGSSFEMGNGFSVQGSINNMLPNPHTSMETSQDQNIDPHYNQNHQAFQSIDYLQQYMPFPDNGCQCGPSCNCLYCSKHPDNLATRDRVEELFNIIEQDRLNQPDASISPTSSFDTQIAPSAFGIKPGFTPGLLPLSPEAFAPENGGSANAQFPINGNGDQPAYWEMTYRVGGCQNGSCRCGDDCVCVGCQTHVGHLSIAQ